MDSQNRRDYKYKRGSKRKRTGSKLEVPVDLRVGLRTYFIALMLDSVRRKAFHHERSEFVLIL